MSGVGSEKLVAPAGGVRHELRQPLRLSSHEGGEALDKSAFVLALIVTGFGLFRSLSGSQLSQSLTRLAFTSA